MNDLNITQRIETVLNILNSMTLTGFQQFNSVAEAMKQLAAINRDIQALEQAAQKQEDVNEPEHQAE